MNAKQFKEAVGKMAQDQDGERAAQTTQFYPEQLPHTRHEVGGARSARITVDHEGSASEREGVERGRHGQRGAPATTQSSLPSNFPLAEAGGAKTASEAGRGPENDELRNTRTASACEESASETFKKDASRHMRQELGKQSRQPARFSREPQRQAAAVSGPKAPGHEKSTSADVQNPATRRQKESGKQFGQSSSFCQAVPYDDAHFCRKRIENDEPAIDGEETDEHKKQEPNTRPDQQSRSQQLQHVGAGCGIRRSEDEKPASARGDDDSDTEMRRELHRLPGKPNQFFRDKHHVEAGDCKTASEDAASPSASADADADAEIQGELGRQSDRSTRPPQEVQHVETVGPRTAAEDQESESARSNEDSDTGTQGILGSQLGKPNRFSRNKQHVEASSGRTASEDNDSASARVDRDSGTEMRWELNRQLGTPSRFFRHKQHLEAGAARTASEDQESESASNDEDSDMGMQGILGRQLGKPNRFSRNKKHVEAGSGRAASEDEGSASARVDEDSDTEMRWELNRQLGKPSRFSRHKQHVEAGGARTASEDEESESARASDTGMQGKLGRQLGTPGGRTASEGEDSALARGDEDSNTEMQDEPGRQLGTPESQEACGDEGSEPATGHEDSEPHAQEESRRRTSQSNRFSREVRHVEAASDKLSSESRRSGRAQ